MKVYVRKIDNQCVEKQVSVLKSVVEDFFGNNLIVENDETVPGGKILKFVGIDIPTKVEKYVRILPQTDPRFSSGDLKNLLSEKYEEGDFLVFYEANRKYEIEVIKPSDSRYEALVKLCERDERHTLFEIESKITNTSNRKEEYKNWLIAKGEHKEETIKNYVRYITYIYEKGYCDIDLFSTDDLDLIDSLLYKFKNDQNYIDYNEQNNRNPYYALIQYQQFIKELKEKHSSDEKDLRTFYIENLKDNAHVVQEISNRKRFIEEYPLEKLLTISKEDYCLGLDNQNSLCYKLEFGDYSETGFGISGYAYKSGMYYSAKDGIYKGKNGKDISNPDEYWDDYRKQLYAFLKEMETQEPNFILDEKYPLLGGTGNYMFLTKLLCLYYPDRFISSSDDETYSKLAKYLNVKFGKNAIQNSYYANIEFRKYIPESKENDAYYISNAIWKFFHEEKAKVEDNGEIVTGAYNKIFYGVPGSGKSFRVNTEFSKDEYYIETITFHPEYTNSDFIGQIIPKVKDNEVEYKFHPGAFTKALQYALTHKGEKVCLKIEEINRGNAAAIFGDIFQLLDRIDDKEKYPNDIGKSRYTIFNGPILDYLHDEGIVIDEVYIPSNMWIVATMNTSDQNVFTLDTAFKRRWKMEYIRNIFDPNDKKYSKQLREAKIPNTEITWEQFVTEINKKIANDDSTINSEDKQMGMYFVTLEEVQNEKEFAEKILSYIWDDVAKIDIEEWFGNIKSYDELLSSYEKNSVKVFYKLFDNYQIHIEENNDEQSNESDTI